MQGQTGIAKFQSTRPCGARHRTAGGTAWAGCFNPRARAGRDRRVGLDRACVGVSIHAPVRGATRLQPFICIARLFQSTRPCGARPYEARWSVQPVRFQSTRPCGARPAMCSTSSASGQFQSTRPCGARPERTGVEQMEQAVFQSTRPCGARLEGVNPVRSHPQFQSTRPCGARPYRNASKDRTEEFQSTRPCGARPLTRSGPS